MMDNISHSHSYKLLSYCTLEEAIDKLGRALYPFSWRPDMAVLYKRKINGQFFGVTGEVDVVEILEKADIQRIVKAQEDFQNPWLKNNSFSQYVHFSTCCGRLSNVSQEGIIYLVEHRQISRLANLKNPEEQIYYKFFLMISNVINILRELIFKDTISIYTLNRKKYTRLSRDDVNVEYDEHWLRVLLNGTYLGYCDDEVEGTSVLEKKVFCHQIDLQRAINTIVQGEHFFDLCIEHAFHLEDSKDLNRSPTNNKDIELFVQNIMGMSSAERPPLERMLEQLLEHYAGFPMQMTEAEMLYLHIRTTIKPEEIESADKEILITDVKQSIRDKGYKALKQQAISAEVEENPEMKGKLVILGVPEAIVTLMTPTVRHIGGCWPSAKKRRTKPRKPKNQ